MAEESNTIIGALTKIASNLQAVQVHVPCEFPPEVKDQLAQIATALQALVARQGGEDSQPEIDV